MYHNVHTKEVIFSLNVKKPGRKEKDILDQIRQVLLSENSIPWSADIPLKWFALEFLLEEMTQALQRGVLSRQECFTAAIDKLHFEEDAAEFEAAIHYLDDLSVLFNYPSILPDVVFADPQVLLDKVAFFKISKVTAKGDSWCKFYEFALVTVEFLSQKDFSKHHAPVFFDVKHLIQLFKKLLIFAHFSDTQLFVPALLRDLDKKDVNK